MAESDTLFKLKPQKPLHILKRPWRVSDFWSRFFPMDEEGIVSFTPPWPSPIYQINEQETGNALISTMKKGLKKTIILFLLLLLASCFFFWNKPELLTVAFVCFYFTRQYARKTLLPRLCAGILTACPLLSKGKKSHSVCGREQRPRVNGRFLSMGLLQTTLIPTAIYWWDGDTTTATFYGALVLLFAGMVAYNYWPLFTRHELPAKIVLEFCLLLPGILWGIALWYCFMPSPPRPMGAWGYNMQSPSSALLGYYQSYMSPIELDRRLQSIDFRPRGFATEWAAYSLSPDEFQKIKTSLLQTTGSNPAEKETLFTEKEKKSMSLQKFPSWWKPALGSEMLFFSYGDTPLKDKLNNRERQTYQKGTERSTDLLIPAKDFRQTMIYDPKSKRLYLLSRERHISPFETLLMHIN